MFGNTEPRERQADAYGDTLTATDERIAASEERYRVMYDETPSMYFTIDACGRVLSVNAFGAEQLGYRPEELLGRPVVDVFVEDDRPAAADYLEVCLANPGQVFHSELRKRRRNGTVLTVRETSRATERDGEQVVLVVCQDITEQKRAEENQSRLEAELRQAQKLEAIGRLAGGVAHDFNNLLTAIGGYLHLVVDAIEPGNPIREDAEEARRAAERAAVLTKQLLTFSSRQPISPEAVDLNEVVADLANLLRRLIGEDVELSTLLEAGLPPVQADRGQLEQVIVNLAINARDAMPDGGTLVIETATTTATDAGGPAVVLSVTDTGIGMDAETRSRIFEPFFTTKGPGKGTGLGLSTVYGIVEEHGGSIAVDGVEGMGTTFRVSLPRASSPVPLTAPPVPMSSQVGSETILLVEDDTPVRSLAARVLRDHGYTVFEAGNASEALRLADRRDGSFDLALSDIVMPGLSGRELERALGTSHPSVRVLLMSGYDRTQGGRGGQAVDGTVLRKPFTPAALLAAVGSALA